MVHPIDKTLDKMLERAIGMQSFVDQLTSTNSQSYPPHNIIKLSDTEYQIELAVAGFKKEELSITYRENTLTVKSQKIEDSTTREYTYRGIGTRNFTKDFILSNDVIVTGADIVDGLLVVDLQRIIPETKKERTIQIGGVK